MPLDSHPSAKPADAVLAYRRDIDGIRGIAVGGVAVYHFFPELMPSGFVGVDVFFVISGFLITSIIAEKRASDAFSLREFYERRIRRILPALLIVLAAVVAVGWVVLLPHEWKSLGEEVAAGSLFSANLLYWSQVGYFDTESSRKILLHLWSLGVEEQFYILWPLIFMVLPARHFWRMAVVTTIASFIACLVVANIASESAFFLPMTRWWELSLGAMLCLARGRMSFFDSQRRRDLASLAGLALVAIALIALSAGSYPNAKALLPTLGTAALIAAGDRALVNRTLLSGRVLVFLGLISFSLYLWHWPIRAYLQIILGGELGEVVRMAALFAAVILSWLTWRFVESPTRRMAAPRFAAALIASLIACAAVGGLMAAGLFPARLSTPEGERISRAVLDKVDKSKMANATLNRIHGGDIVTWNPAGTKATLVIGDSLMAQLLPRINALSPEIAAHSRKVILATRGGCLPVKEIRDYRKKSCAEFVTEALKLAEQADVDTVVIGGRWYPKLMSNDIFVESAGGVVSMAEGQGLALAASLLEGSLKAIAGMRKKVYLVAAFPTSPKFDPATYATPCARLGSCPLSLAESTYPRAASQALTRPVDEALAAAAARAGATILDPYGQLCTATDCNLLGRGGELIYRDKVHISEGYMQGHFTMLDSLLLGSAP